METQIKDGFYTRAKTTSTIAIIKNEGYHVAFLVNKFTKEVDKVITNEKITFTKSFIDRCVYEPFESNLETK